MRDLLERLVPAFDGLVDELWCPEDVYPVYAEIIGSRRRREYCMIPHVEWGRLADASLRAAVLCPMPLSPLGRFPSVGEVAELASWLARSEARYLFVDAVYTYDFEALSRALAPLLETGRAVSLFSCAKSWLMPDAWGLASMTSTLHARLASRSPTSPADTSRVTDWLTQHPELPRFQQQAFAREWRRLAPRIQAAAPSWQPPATGYFSVVDVSFETLLQHHDILAVPATVFGSKRRECSVLACLHDLVEHESGGA